MVVKRRKRKTGRISRVSVYEDKFMEQIERAGNLPIPTRQYRFHRTRKWQADFAWVNERIIVEIEGGVYIGGRHVSGSGFEKDCEKYNAATVQGWSVYRFTTGMVNRGIALDVLKQAFGVQ